MKKIAPAADFFKKKAPVEQAKKVHVVTLGVFLLEIHILVGLRYVCMESTLKIVIFWNLDS